MKNFEPVEKTFPFEDSLTNFSGIENSNLLLVIDLEGNTINYINPIIEIYCGIDAGDIISGKKDFYTEVLHPEDYKDLLEHFNSFSTKDDQGEKEVILRLKTNRTWTRFCFKSRLYKWRPNGEICPLLTQAHAVPLNLLEDEGIDLCSEENFHEPPGRYHTFLDSIDEAYCIIKMIFNKEGAPVDYLFTETNAAFENHVNLKNVVGKTMRELEPGMEDQWFQIYGKVAVTGEPLRFQEKAENLDRVWFDVYAFRPGGNHSRSVAVLFHNITKRKLAEETLLKTKSALEKKALRNQQEILENSNLLQSVFDTTNLAIAVFRALYDKNGNIMDLLFVRVNKVLRQMYLQQDPLGSTYTETSKYGIEMGIFDAFKTVLETGEAFDREFFFDKDGYNNWFRVTAMCQNDLLITTIEDITARKAETLQLQEIMRFNEQLVRTSPDTIFIIDLNKFQVRYINQDLLTRAGMTKEKILGMTLPEILPFLHPRDREKIIDFHKKILKSSDDEIIEVEFRVKIKGRKWEWFNARGKIFSRKNDEWVNEYVILARNITEQKTTERSLISAEKLSIQGEIARTFAHELRNPLASIRLATDVIHQKLGESQKQELENYLDILTRSTQTLNNLVSRLLNASNYSPAKLRKVDLAECLDITVEQAADRIYLTGIKVEKNYRGPYYIMADTEKLKIALLNIIVNASEATTPQEGIIKLTIKEHKTDYLLSITDNGHGLEQDQIDRLFDAFYTSKSTGAGIGLTSVKNILEEHDAQINVISEPKIGTTFEIYFHNATIE